MKKKLHHRNEGGDVEIYFFHFSLCFNLLIDNLGRLARIVPHTPHGTRGTDRYSSSSESNISCTRCCLAHHKPCTNCGRHHIFYLQTSHNIPLHTVSRTRPMFQNNLGGTILQRKMSNQSWMRLRMKSI